MKKINKIKEEIVSLIGASASNPILGEANGTKYCEETCKRSVGKLTTTFPNEDLNKLVEKINEIIDNI